MRGEANGLGGRALSFAGRWRHWFEHDDLLLWMAAVAIQRDRAVGKTRTITIDTTSSREEEMGYVWDRSPPETWLGDSQARRRPELIRLRWSFTCKTEQTCQLAQNAASQANIRLVSASAAREHQSRLPGHIPGRDDVDGGGRFKVETEHPLGTTMYVSCEVTAGCRRALNNGSQGT